MAIEATKTGITTTGQYRTSLSVEGDGYVMLRAWNAHTQSYAEMPLHPRFDLPGDRLLASLGPEGREVVERGMAAAAFGRSW